MKFGIDIRGKLTGADLAVRITQIAAALPMLYLVILSGMLSLLTHETPVTYLFSLGVCAVPRAVALGLSVLYRHTGGEVLFSMLLVAAALVYGVVMNRLLHSERGRTVRIVLAALIALDLIVRLIPLGFTQAFGLPCEIIAFVLRAVSLVLVLLDLRAGKKA